MATPREWVSGARPRTLPAAIVPVTVGSGVAFGYVVSHIRQDLSDNRAGLLVQAVRACLE